MDSQREFGHTKRKRLGGRFAVHGFYRTGSSAYAVETGPGGLATLTKSLRRPGGCNCGRHDEAGGSLANQSEKAARVERRERARARTLGAERRAQ
jgi:hypothetical protein